MQLLASKLAQANKMGLRKEGETMMPLTFASEDTVNIIRRVGGSPEVKKHLENLGFVAGGSVRIVSRLGGNVIVNVKESRVAISEEMARKILV